MKVKILLLVAMMLVNVSVFAEKSNLKGKMVSVAYKSDDCVIKGTVKDEKGEMIVGAVLVDKVSKKGVVTDKNGKFSLQVPKGAEIDVVYPDSRKYTFVAGEENEQEKNIILVFDKGGKKDTAKIKPLIIVDGNPYEILGNIPSAKIKSMTVIKKDSDLKTYIKKYGDMVKNGVVLVELKDSLINN